MPWEKRLFTLGKPHVRLKTTLLDGFFQGTTSQMIIPEWCFGRPPAPLPLQWLPGGTFSGLPGGGVRVQVKIPQSSVFLLPFLSNAPQIAASLWLISRALMKLILTIFTRVLIPFNEIFWGPCSAIFTDIIFPVLTGMFAWSYFVWNTFHR